MLKKIINTKRGFQCLYTQVILIDAIYRKDENYFPKEFFFKKYFIEDVEIFRSNSDTEKYDNINLFPPTVQR